MKQIISNTQGYVFQVQRVWVYVKGNKSFFDK